jgi:hypothetical protein
MRAALAEARDAGIDFADAWREALPGAVADLSGHEARSWAEALAETRDGWRRAYGGEPVWGLTAALD